MSRFGIVVLVTAATLCGTAASALARTVYDGRWSVQIITERGTCDRGYRYSIDIRDGIVHYNGDVVDMQGRVAKNGMVRVVVSRGSLSASGVGRLGRDYGEGKWRGGDGNDSCSGRWEAERR
jgi:hypothetical protein